MLCSRENCANFSTTNTRTWATYESTNKTLCWCMHSHLCGQCASLSPLVYQFPSASPVDYNYIESRVKKRKVGYEGFFLGRKESQGGKFPPENAPYTSQFLSPSLEKKKKHFSSVGTHSVTDAILDLNCLNSAEILLHRALWDSMSSCRLYAQEPELAGVLGVG